MLRAATVVDPMLTDPRRVMLTQLERRAERCKPARGCKRCAHCTEQQPPVDNEQTRVVMETIEQLLRI